MANVLHKIKIAITAMFVLLVVMVYLPLIVIANMFRMVFLRERKEFDNTK